VLLFDAEQQLADLTLSEVEDATEDEEEAVLEALNMLTEDMNGMAMVEGDQPPEPTPIRPRIVETPQERTQRRKLFAERYAEPFGGSYATFMKAEASRRFDKEEKAAETAWQESEWRRVTKEQKAISNWEKTQHQQQHMHDERRRKTIEATRRRVRQRNKAREVEKKRAEERWKQKRNIILKKKKKNRQIMRRWDKGEERTWKKDAWKEMDSEQTPCFRHLRSDDRPMGDTNGVRLPHGTLNTIRAHRWLCEGKDEIILYSDGSLMNSGTQDISMAFAVVMQSDDGTYKTAISGRTSGYASSTKAELTGLYAAILVSPRNKPTTVRIDNMAVVTQFQHLVQQRPYCTERQRLRSPYSIWWSAIHNAYEHQGRLITVEWVRGHQGNEGNEAADKAAKQAHHGNVWELDTTQHNDLQCHALFNDQPAEDDLRQILKLQSAARIHQTWKRQNRTERYIRDWTEIDWRSTLAIIHNGNAPKRLFTSTADCKKRAHRVKKMHGMLPTLTYMKRWRPDLYPSDTCRMCRNAPEDTYHLWRCPSTLQDQLPLWQDAVGSVNNTGHTVWGKAWKAWNEERKKWEEQERRQPLGTGKPFTRKEPSFVAAGIDRIWSTLETMFSGVSMIRNAGFEGYQEQAIADADWTVQDLYHGLVPKALTTTWKEVFNTSTAIAAYMAGRFVEQIEEIGRTEIWNKRCDATIEWERDLGITTWDKRRRNHNAAEYRPANQRFMGPLPRHNQAQDELGIGTDADFRVLHSYLGEIHLDLMERLGGVKFSMASTAG
jgi:ribonuclease HI